MIALSLDQMVQRMVDQAHSVLVGTTDGAVQPFFHIQFNNRAPSIIVTPWTNDDEKHAATYAMRAVLQKFRDHVVSYAFMSEAWMASYDNEALKGDYPMPRDRPDRREVVIINAFDHKDYRFKVLFIERDAKGKVVRLTPDDRDEYTGLEGNLHNLLGEDSQVH
jgi:hypothetical protein